MRAVRQGAGRLRGTDDLRRIASRKDAGHHHAAEALGGAALVRRARIVGLAAGNQRLAFSANGTHLLAQANPAAYDHSDTLKLVDPIQVFRIGDGKCEKIMDLH